MRFALCDSSPSNAGDFLWCHHKEVDIDKVIEVVASLNEVILLSSLAAAEENESDADFVAEPSERVRSHLKQLLHIADHAHPPTGVTSGMRSLPHNIAAISWAWSLQLVTLRDFQLWRNTFQSMTTDSGVELGIADFYINSTNIGQLFPTWSEFAGGRRTTTGC